MIFMAYASTSIDSRYQHGAGPYVDTYADGNEMVRVRMGL